MSEYATVGDNYTIDLEALVMNKNVGTFSLICDYTFTAVEATETVFHSAYDVSINEIENILI